MYCVYPQFLLILWKQTWVEWVFPPPKKNMQVSNHHILWFIIKHTQCIPNILDTPLSSLALKLNTYIDMPLSWRSIKCKTFFHVPVFPRGFISAGNRSFVLEPSNDPASETHWIYRAEHLDISGGTCGHGFNMTLPEARNLSHPPFRDFSTRVSPQELNTRMSFYHPTCTR